MISLCMIVKNEERVIAKCLESVTKLVDEIIVVDTGSVDSTIEIAKNYTDKIFNYTWDDDFAAARNFSISKASNDWILVLDADELLIDYDEKTILDFCRNLDKVGRIEISNYFEDSIGIKKNIERVNRLFNRRFFEYDGIIHEQIIKRDKTQYSTKEIDIKINHIGYTQEVISKTNKINRNITLLSKAIKNKPKDPYLIYQLGKSYFMDKKYREAYEKFKKALEFIYDFKYEYIEDLVESYGYSMLELKMYNEARILYNYEIYYNNKADFVFLVALIEMNNGDFQNAAEIFLRCTELKNGKIEGITSFLPLYNIGVIFECVGMVDEAVSYYKMCGNYEQAVERINSISKK